MSQTSLMGQSNEVKQFSKVCIWIRHLSLQQNKKCWNTMKPGVYVLK